MMDKQKYWQYASEDIIDTGKRNLITDGFLIDYDISSIDKSLLLETRPLINKSAPKKIKHMFERCNVPDKIVSFGRQYCDEQEYSGFYLYEFESGRKAQRKFVEYFRKLYPDCGIYINPLGKREGVFCVKVNGQIVGGFMGIHHSSSFYPIEPATSGGKVE